MKSTKAVGLNRYPNGMVEFPIEKETGIVLAHPSRILRIELRTLDGGYRIEFEDGYMNASAQTVWCLLNNVYIETQAGGDV